MKNIKQIIENGKLETMNNINKIIDNEENQYNDEKLQNMKNLMKIIKNKENIEQE